MYRAVNSWNYVSMTFRQCIFDVSMMTWHLPTTLDSRAQDRLRSLIARRRVEIYGVVWRVYSACRFVFVLALVEMHEAASTIC